MSPITIAVDGTVAYAARAPGDLQLLIEATIANPALSPALTVLYLDRDSDGMTKSGILEFMEAL